MGCIEQEAASPIPAVDSLRQVRLSRVCYIATSFVLLILTLGSALPEHRDYVNFATIWASGRAAARGENPYAAYPETHRVDFSKRGGPASQPDLNFNPPFTLPAFQLLSRLRIHSFVALWIFAMWICLCTGIVLLVEEQRGLQNRQIVWLSLSMPALFALGSGQVYGPMFLLSVLAVLFQKRGRESAAAIAIGTLIAIRPLMVLWPFYLYLAGHRKIAARSLGVMALLYALPLPVYGVTIYRQWLNAILGRDFHWMDTMNIGFIPLSTRLGIRPVGFILSAVVICACAVWALKFRPKFVWVSGAALCAGILCAPIGWSAYMIFAAPMFVMRSWRWISSIASLSFFVLGNFVESTSGIPAFLGTVAILGCFLAWGLDTGASGASHSNAGLVIDGCSETV